MNLMKVKGIVIKETPYKDNDKIITILTDKLGKISCMAKGCKRTKSPILANCQYLVYSEFILSKSNTFYYVNSASVIKTFYNFRTNFDNLQIGFELTKMLQTVTDENQDTEDILRLLLNTIYVLENIDKDAKLVVAAFKIKLFSLLGFSPQAYKCNMCGQAFKENREQLTTEGIYYDYVSNFFCCSECVKNLDKRRYIKVTEATIIAIKYVMICEISKTFSFTVKDIDNFYLFSQVYADTMTNGI
ncbi:MAG: DNA repair protein RecO [Clostridia bacterium]|nr:DNA repair protein RecO [Clostridia bacterium]